MANFTMEHMKETLTLLMMIAARNLSVLSRLPYNLLPNVKDILESVISVVCLNIYIFKYHTIGMDIHVIVY
jgi:hypothetical protein